MRGCCWGWCEVAVCEYERGAAGDSVRKRFVSMRAGAAGDGVRGDGPLLTLSTTLPKHLGRLA